jgi:hypothetical protein
MVISSWTTFFLLISLAFSLALMVVLPVFFWWVGWEWWIGLVVAGALCWPLVQVGGYLGIRLGGILADRYSISEEQ